MRHNRLSLVILVLLLITGVLGASACAPASRSAYGPDALELAQAIPDWVQVNGNGFGDPKTVDMTALESFNGYLYVEFGGARYAFVAWM